MEEKKIYVSFSVVNNKVEDIALHLQRETCLTHIFKNLNEDHYIDLRAKWLLLEDEEEIVDIEEYLIENCFESFFIPSIHDEYENNMLISIKIDSIPVKHYMQILGDGDKLVFNN